jgi:hypothetical protein
MGHYIMLRGNHEKEFFGFPFDKFELIENSDNKYIRISLVSLNNLEEAYDVNSLNLDEKTKQAINLLEPIKKLMENNSVGRKYKIIDYEYSFNGQEVLAAIVPAEGRVVSPVIMGNNISFVVLNNLPTEEKGLLEPLM